MFFRTISRGAEQWGRKNTSSESDTKVLNSGPDLAVGRLSGIF